MYVLFVLKHKQFVIIVMLVPFVECGLIFRSFAHRDSLVTLGLLFNFSLSYVPFVLKHAQFGMSISFSE